MDAMYAITGATGALGGRVAARLSEQRHDLRLVVRDASRAPRLEGVDVEEASYPDTEAMRAALVGTDTLFFVSAPESADRVDQHVSALDAAAAAGVRRVVYLSFLAAGPEVTFTFSRDHWRTEEHLRALGLPHTILRPSLYLDLVPTWVGADGLVRGPAGTGRVAWVSRDDVADVAAAVLTGEGHDGATYDVTGPQAVTLDETVTAIAAAAGREIGFVDETLEEARASRAHSGAEPWEIDGWVSSYAAIGAGELNVVADTVERLTGHPATGLADYLAAHPEALDQLRTS